MEQHKSLRSILFLMLIIAVIATVACCAKKNTVDGAALTLSPTVAATHTLEPTPIPTATDPLPLETAQPTETPAVTALPTPVVTDVPFPTLVPPVTTAPLSCPSGGSCSVDLDGDAVQETIAFDCSQNEGYADSCVFTVNGTDYAPKLLEFIGESGYEVIIGGALYVTDINTADSHKELALSLSYPHDGVLCRVYYMTYSPAGLSLLAVTDGVVEGNSFPNKTVEDTSAVYYGNGMFTSIGYLSVLQGWCAPFTYQLHEGVLYRIESPLYMAYVSEDWSYSRLNMNLEVYASNDELSAKSVLPAGSEIQFVATDNKSWVELTCNGAVYWFYMPTNRSVRSNGTEHEIFEFNLPANVFETLHEFIYSWT